MKINLLITHADTDTTGGTGSRGKRIKWKKLKII